LILLKSIIIFTVSFIVTKAAVKILTPLLQTRYALLDIPNARSLHKSPIPKAGGGGIVIGSVAGLCVAWLFGMPLPRYELLLGTTIIVLVGFADDYFGDLSIVGRLSLQIAAALLVVSSAGGLERLPLPEPLDISLGPLIILGAVVWIVGVTNIYNFLDGIDGFAGFQGVVIYLGMTLLKQDTLVATGLVIGGACCGFLVHNWHPARVFLGNMGSGMLGFVVAALPFQLDLASRSEAVFVTAVGLWFFLSDGVFTILRRFLHHERIWDAHCSHLYQRLVKTGVRHDQVALRIIGAAAVLNGLAIVSIRIGKPSIQWGVLITAVGAFLAYYRWVQLREKFLAREPNCSSR